MAIWIPNQTAPALHVVKPIYKEQMPRLDHARLRTNALVQRETAVFFDTNVLGQIYSFALAGGRSERLREFGLDELIRILSQTPDRNVALVPGVAVQELPPVMVARFHSAFEWFLSRFLPQYRDHPRAIPGDLWIPQVENTFWDRALEARAALALSYSLLLLMQAVLSEDSTQTPEARFRLYVQLVLNEIDVLSVKEIEVCRWCLSPPIDRDSDYQKRRLAISRNFSRLGRKRARSIADLRSIALNGAHDLWLIAMVVHSDAKGLEGTAQDSWIATYDGKLAEYCKVFNYLPMGILSGSFAVFAESPSDLDSGYWKSTAGFLSDLFRKRAAQSHRKSHSVDEMMGWARRCEAILDAIAGMHFRSTA